MEKANGFASQRSGIAANRGVLEGADAHGHYHVQCFGPGGLLKWEDDIENVVCTEGKNALLTAGFKGSAFTQTAYLGLINGTSYTAVDATNAAASITTGSAATPANGWNEVSSATVASRGAPSFGSASAGSLALSAAQAFTVTGPDTIKGCFVLIKSAAGVAPTSAPGNTNGALWSAGLFSGGDKGVDNGDTLNVSYSTSL